MTLVSSKLDYCNSLFHNMPEKNIARLQRVQNCLARMVTKAPRFSRSVPIQKRLHWLPVKFRIHFKICAITFRTLKDNQPTYLADFIVRQKCSNIYVVQLPAWLTLQSLVLQGFLMDFCSYGVWEVLPLSCPLDDLGQFFMRPKGQFLGSKGLILEIIKK